jgi:hypothetical protein
VKEYKIGVVLGPLGPLWMDTWWKFLMHMHYVITLTNTCMMENISCVSCTRKKKLCMCIIGMCEKRRIRVLVVKIY